MQCFDTIGPTSWYQVVFATGAASGPSSPTSVPQAASTAMPSRVILMEALLQQCAYPLTSWGKPSGRGETRQLIALTGLANAGTGTFVHDLTGRVEVAHHAAARRLIARQVVHARIELRRWHVRHRRGRRTA